MWTAEAAARVGEPRLRRTQALVGGLLVLVGVIGSRGLSNLQAQAACTPAAYPNDPGYAPAERGTPGATWDGEQWYLYGCMPSSAPASSDAENAAGMSVDRVWNELNNRGSDQVTVAYMEGGVNWRAQESCDLKDRARLNTGELPYPEDASGRTRIDLGLGGDPYDLNGDGVVNVEDYLNDPRVRQALVGVPKSSRVANPMLTPFLHHVCDTSISHIPVAMGGTDITPEDLIVAFGHCELSGGAVVGAFPCAASRHYDNDHNGYANDINGWNFNRDTNDPQTEQSIYGHFNGESSRLVGEANNGFSDAGMCPLCRYIPIKAGDEAIDRPDRVAEAIVYCADNGVKVMDVTSASLGLTQTVKEAIDYAWKKGMVVVFASNDFESADHTDGMFYPHVWPGNSLTGDHSTRGGATCNLPPTGPGDALCPWVTTNTTFRARSSLTSYGPHALFSAPNPDGSTSAGTPTQAGVAALVFSEAARDNLSPMLNADEVKQVVRSTASYIGTLSTCPHCFQGIDGTNFNIQYGYGRPNVYNAAVAVDHSQVPPTADIRTPDWYQAVDPTRQSMLEVRADVAARRAGSYTWELQYGMGPQPLDSDWHTFSSGTGAGPQSVTGNIPLSDIAASFATAPYALDVAGRTSIEKYDVSVRARVYANGDRTTSWRMGEDRRAFQLRHDSTERTGFPVKLGSSGDASPAMADIEGRGWLDTIVATADGTVHAYRPDATEAPGFPLHTGPSPGMDPASDVNYLGAPGWSSGAITRSRDGFLSPPAVGDLRHDGGLEIVASSLSGRTYAWDGLGRLLPGFPVLNGDSSFFHLSVPPPDTPYSFEPENIAGGAPVLADLEKNRKLDNIQTAGDNRIHAWRPDGTPVPGWPVSALLPAGTIGAGMQQTHDSKIVTTPALADINGDGIPDVVVGLDDSILGTGPAGAGVKAFLVAFDGRGTTAGGSVPGNPAMLPGYPVQIQGLLQGYGVAQDFVTQGTESPAVYDSPTGPQAIVNANLFLPWRVDLKTASVQNPFAAAVIPPFAATSGVAAAGAMVPFTTSATIGNVLGGATPQVFQPGSAAAEVAVSITQLPGFGGRVDNGLQAWDPTTGATLQNFNQYIQGLAFFGAPAVADITGDGTPDILLGADSAALHGIDGVTGQAAIGFPKWSGGWSLWTPTVGDLTGTGTVSVAVTTREGYLHVWDTPGKTVANNQAWHWHQDDRNTGHYGTDTRPPAGVRDLSVITGPDKWKLNFTAPGDDWNSGTASAYEARCSPNPITQANFAQATAVDLGGAKPQVAGSKESISFIPAAGSQYCVVRAVDAAGNIGPIPLGAATSSDGGQPPSNPPALPNTAGDRSGIMLLLFLLLAATWHAARAPRRGTGEISPGATAGARG
ncbi:MAG: S8 family serine peptidase [Candidatus Dormibacteria bacterium]